MSSKLGQILPKVGVVFSAFDLMHAGHVLMLKEAKSHCDYLLVGLHSDPSIDRPKTKNTPVLSLEERKVLLEGCKYVDGYFVYDTEQELHQYLNSNHDRIGVRFLGDDYRGQSFTGDQFPIPIHYISRDHGFSTSGLRSRVVEEAARMVKDK